MANNIARFEVIRNPIGVIQVDNETKDSYILSYLISKNNVVIHLTQYELDNIFKEVKQYVGKNTIVE